MKEKIEKILNRITKIGGESNPLIYKKPATETELILIEKKLGFKIPNDFRNILLNVSSHLEFSWFLADDFKLPEELNEIFSGDIHWEAESLVGHNMGKEDWIEGSFNDPSNEYDKVWHNKFVFQTVGNGDYLSIDVSNENYGKIVYVSINDSKGHGHIMANSFSELLKNWIDLGCPGADGNQWIPFTKDKVNGIDSKCENAMKWQKLIGIE